MRYFNLTACRSLVLLSKSAHLERNVEYFLLESGFSALVFCHSKQCDAKKKKWNLRSMHTSDTAQHTIGVLVFALRAKKDHFMF